MSTAASAEPIAATSLVRSRLWIFVPLTLFFSALWFVLCRHLSEEWSYNEQYSYGWFVPFFAAYLFWLRWQDRPKLIRNGKSEIRNPTAHRAVATMLVLFALLLLLPIRLFEIGNPAWRPLDWLHASLVVGLTLLTIWTAGGRAWLWHFAFPICFFFVAVPWFNSIEEPIVQALMRGAAAFASEALNLFGIPAQVEGGVIRVNAGIVGVNEACSGVRSLQTSIMIGLLFGELHRLSVRRRLWLVVAIIAVALFSNAARSFFLVWIAATRGLPTMEHLHDLAGYAILVIVFLAAILIARRFAGLEARVPMRRREPLNIAAATSSSSGFLVSPFYLLLFFSWLVGVEIAAEGWYRAHERDLVPQAQWTAVWPETAPGFRNIPTDERSKRLLRFDEGRGATWRGKTPPVISASSSSALSATQPDLYLLFFFRWYPGQNNALLASVHRPDVCLPATGWQQIADDGVRYYTATEELRLPFRHFEFTHAASIAGVVQHAHAFYCLWEDRVHRDGESNAEALAGAASDWSLAERVRVVMEGRRHLGQRAMELVMSNTEERTASDAEAKFAEILPTLVRPAR